MQELNIEWIENGGVTSAQGFLAGGARGEIKTTGEDVGLIAAAQAVPSGVVFTRNVVKAAPVQISIENSRRGTLRGIVYNSGNANCATGAQGLQAARRMCELAAAKLNCDASEILVCSTGIIGHQLPMDKVEKAFSQIELQRGDAANAAAARASMTTDTRPKFCAARAEIGDKTVTVGGQVKGVGMIGPDMGPAGAPHATLLAFVTTDAALDSTTLQRAVEQVSDRTFNSVTVDGDTSTNDTFAVLASGESGVTIDDSSFESFCALLQAVCTKLAKLVAADGEGATKVVEVQVQGAQTPVDARRVAMTIANSPLVKTAIFGNDPNWGRIAMAAGRSGTIFNPANLRIQLNDITVFDKGEPVDFPHSEAVEQMRGEELIVRVILGEGEASWTAWTCDFSYDYVKINAEYHT